MSDTPRTHPPVAPPAALDARTLRAEVVLVLAGSLGASAVYSVVSIVGRLTASTRLSAQHATLNASQAPGRPWLDLTYQLIGIAFALVPAALAIHLLGRTTVAPLRAIGLDTTRVRFDLGLGGLLAVVIGIPGLALYLAARGLGLNATVVPAALPSVWWMVPVLIAAAIQNALLEEVVVVGYLLTRLGDLGWSPRRAVGASALLRGAYHLYQGFGGFAGNLVMGLVFGAVYRRWGRVAPLVVAHSLLDVAAFVGYAALRGHVSWLP
jgi:membrane protease YdiL (CAAX protease family)